jgi:hypothetical protein
VVLHKIEQTANEQTIKRPSIHIAVRKMRRSNLIVLCAMALMLCLQSAMSSPLFMNVEEGGKKCFLEDVPKDTLVVIKYKSVQKTAGSDPYTQHQGEQKGWIVTVDGPSNEFIARRELGDEGRYAFTAQVGGEHKICLQTNTGRWFAQGAEFVCPPTLPSSPACCIPAHLPSQELEVDVETGVGATDYAEVARLESLSGTHPPSLSTATRPSGPL